MSIGHFIHREGIFQSGKLDDFEIARDKLKSLEATIEVTVPGVYLILAVASLLILTIVPFMPVLGIVLSLILIAGIMGAMMMSLGAYEEKRRVKSLVERDRESLFANNGKEERRLIAWHREVKGVLREWQDYLADHWCTVQIPALQELRDCPSLIDCRTLLSPLARHYMAHYLALRLEQGIEVGTATHTLIQEAFKYGKSEFHLNHPTPVPDRHAQI